jgi:hypothetical protein
MSQENNPQKPLEWLLQPDDVGVRYLALRALRTLNLVDA